LYLLVDQVALLKTAGPRRRWRQWRWRLGCGPLLAVPQGQVIHPKGLNSKGLNSKGFNLKGLKLKRITTKGLNLKRLELKRI
jgi:hypothetical protein